MHQSGRFGSRESQCQKDQVCGNDPFGPFLRYPAAMNILGFGDF